MSDRTPSRMAFIVPSVVCFAIATAAGMQLSRNLNEDFYWTPKELAPTLEEARDRVEVYYEEELLQRRAERGDLRSQEGERAIAPDDIRVRINNFDRVARGHWILLSVSLTAAIILLIVGLSMPGRRRRPLGP